MDMTAINAFCTHSSVVVVAGKGGVGKSTLSATVASLAARNGVSVLLVELEAGSGPSTVFGHHGLTADEVDLSAGGTGDRDPRSAPIRARTITPDDALVDYLVDHGFGPRGRSDRGGRPGRRSRHHFSDQRSRASGLEPSGTHPRSGR
jgi:hypothetical protein